ncbi:DUF3883 domain-containing protein [Rhizobium sp. WYCCWR 11279]|uniref:DUF3883 domain-containing protein n=1 Tax=Rhizobium changzhiense TaxID=2692317 RepID=UPI0014923C1D|nr:DUF3883 domain-containing protein [Rhizobium changzhiense]NNU50449.1 DUF3883 domain-containing protein [Rhizobium changzhiense]
MAVDDENAFDEIAEGLADLGAEALLFLKHVEEISWTIEGRGSGRYRRDSVAEDFMQAVKLLSSGDAGDQEETYFLFSRAVENDGKYVGLAEIAFLVADQDGKWVIQPLDAARLVVFFPTVLPTYTGFLIQGPYQTTPSRDNIPTDRAWNAKVATLTGDLLIEVLVRLRDMGLLDVAALRSLPLERHKLAGTLFAPLFDKMVQALKDEPLLPTAAADFASATTVRLARAQDVRDLFNADQLGKLLATESDIHWMTPEVTADRAPQLRSFLMQELKIGELTIEAVLTRLSDEFLEEQSDEWMRQFYGVLAGQPALWRGRAREMALLRLEDGRQVPFMKHGVIQAFLPDKEKTDFPTVRASLVTEETLKFLQGFGLMRPDPVEDVIRNLLPKYRGESVDLSHYSDDIARMLRAFDTDSAAQRTKLVEAMKGATIVAAIQGQTGKKYVCYPTSIYLRSKRISNLLGDVSGIFMVDRSYDCLHNEKVREMLEACGSTRYLRTVRCECNLSPDDRHALRRAAGWEGFSSENPIQDVDIAGLDGLLSLIPSLPEDERRDRARQLWEALMELVERRGQSVLGVTYTWNYHYLRSTTLDAAFVRKLNRIAWICDRQGVLRQPCEILFDDLDWPRSPVLESRLAFKPPAIAALAREVGIDPDVLDELKRLGVTDLEQLRMHLKIDQPVEKAPEGEEARRTPSGDTGRSDEARNSTGTGHDTGGRSSGAGGAHQGGTGGEASGTRRSDGAERTAGPGAPDSQQGGRREFISYVALQANNSLSDADGTTMEERMALEEKGIERILVQEPQLRRTQAGNEGFDLFEDGKDGKVERWIEVKAMSAALSDRPVALSKAQIEYARRFGSRYWLYIVEYAADDQRARLLKICDPFGAARMFTFDRGWVNAAEIVDLAGDTDSLETIYADAS